MTKAIFKRYSTEACELRKSLPAEELCADEDVRTGWRSGFDADKEEAKVAAKDWAMLSEANSIGKSQIVQ